MGKPVELWCKNLFEPRIDNLFYIVSRVAIAYDLLEDEVLVTIPLIY